MNQESRNIGIISGENNKYHQIGNGCLEFSITVRKNDTTIFDYGDPIRLLNIAFAFWFTEALLSTTLRSDIEHNKFCGQVSTIMRVISNKVGDFLSQFDNINGKDIPILERLADLLAQILTTPCQKMLINNHTDVKKSKIKRYLFLEDIFGFCKNFDKVTRNFGFHLVFKTANLQNIIHTSRGDDINVTINSLYLYVPNLIPSVETQSMFKEATQNIYKISFEKNYTERQVISDFLVQHDIGLAQQVNSPNLLIDANQTRIRSDTPNKNINIAIFDNLDPRKNLRKLMANDNRETVHL